MLFVSNGQLGLKQVTSNTNRQPLRGANRRLLTRLLVLAVIGVVATYLEYGYEGYGRRSMLFAELTVYLAGIAAFLRGQTGRLKSGPDSSKVSSALLFEQDPSVRVYIALYLMLLMLITVAHVWRGNDVNLGPWSIFVSVCPILLIVFIRQHRLERIRDSDLQIHVR